MDPRIWNDEKLVALSERGKLVFLFTLTHPLMTSLGAMRATLPGLAAELGMAPEAFREAFAEGLAKAIVEHDGRASFIGLPNFLRYNSPESPNVVKGWDKVLDYIPECDLRRQLIKRVRAFTEGMGKAFRDALPKVFQETSPDQEQEQEQEHDGRLSDVCPEPRSRGSEQSSAGEPEAATAKAIMVFPTVGKGGSTWPLLDAKLEEYRQSFPGVDVLSELRKALQWCRDNPAKRKTFSGIPAFLGRWLARAQNSGRGVPMTNGVRPEPFSGIKAAAAKRGIFAGANP